jgi:hypothetical protein
MIACSAGSSATSSDCRRHSAANAGDRVSGSATATLYYQAIPPYYLNQRLRFASQPADRRARLVRAEPRRDRPARKLEAEARRSVSVGKLIGWSPGPGDLRPDPAGGH